MNTSPLEAVTALVDQAEAAATAAQETAATIRAIAGGGEPPAAPAETPRTRTKPQPRRVRLEPPPLPELLVAPSAHDKARALRRTLLEHSTAAIHVQAHVRTEFALSVLDRDESLESAAYRTQAILKASPAKRVALLLGGAARYTARACDLLDPHAEDQAPELGAKLGLAIAIIGELDACLDAERGAEIASRLAEIYSFCIDELFNARLDPSHAKLEDVGHVLATLRSGWEAIPA